MVTYVVCVGIVIAYYYFGMSTAAVVHKCYNRNCLDSAQLKTSDYDEAAGLWDCTYEYSYKGRQYTYHKMFFHEEPPDELILLWLPNSPASAFTEQDIEGKTMPLSDILVKILCGGVAGVVLGLFMSPLAAIFIILGVCLWKRSYRLFSTPMFIAGLFCFFLFAMANIDPLAYSEVSWELKEHPTVSYKMSIINELSPEEIDRLYYDWHWLNEDIKMGHLGRKSPIFGVYTNKHWLDMEEIPWPAEYARWLDVDYRNSMLEENAK